VIDLEVAEGDPPPLQEPDDMKVIEFSCHPEAPVKVAEEWSRTVHCPICGELT
jgi:hypothetical protein